MDKETQIHTAIQTLNWQILTNDWKEWVTTERYTYAGMQVDRQTDRSTDRVLKIRHICAKT